MNATEFEEKVALAYRRRLFTNPDHAWLKVTRERSLDGSCRSMSRWQKWCCEPVPVSVEAWLRIIGDSEVELGIACGRGCIDVDQ